MYPETKGLREYLLKHLEHFKSMGLQLSCEWADQGIEVAYRDEAKQIIAELLK